jgi:hypothetical protein
MTVSGEDNVQGGQLLILDFAFWENRAWGGARSATARQDGLRTPGFHGRRCSTRALGADPFVHRLRIATPAASGPLGSVAIATPGPGDGGGRMGGGASGVGGRDGRSYRQRRRLDFAGSAYPALTRTIF